MPEIKFVLSDVQQARRKRPPNRYTNRSDDDGRPPMWRATLTADRIPDRTIEFWFDTEASARRIPKGTISTLQLWELLTPLDTVFVNQGVDKGENRRKKNLYTDQWVPQNQWAASFEAQRGNMLFADLWYPVEKEAQAWNNSAAYHPVDFLRVYGIFITWYPASSTIPEGKYAAGFQTEGFFDKFGYHVPGLYPAGVYPAGFFTGFFIPYPNVPSNFSGNSYGSFATLLKVTPTGFVVDQGGEIINISF